MKNLYEILEVDEKASKEVIDKVYRVLAKKYHPDLQEPKNREIAEKKMKEINEAYEILSDDNKRRQYDEQLYKEREIKKQQEQDINYSQNVNYGTEQASESSYNTNQYTEEDRYRDMQRRKYEEQLRKQQEQMRRQMEKNMQKQYENAYYNYLRSLGFRIKERWTWEKTKKTLLTIIIMIGIIAILWFLPPTHNMMVRIYEDNFFIKIIVDIIIGIVVAMFETIGNLFKNLFS